MPATPPPPLQVMQLEMRLHDLRDVQGVSCYVASGTLDRFQLPAAA
jgi:hypothetical protein